MDSATRNASPVRSEAASPQRRLEDLAAAVRQHQQAIRNSRPLGARAQDDHLYRRLRQICGER